MVVHPLPLIPQAGCATPPISMVANFKLLQFPDSPSSGTGYLVPVVIPLIGPASAGST